jgi:long-chain alkane monooxygenase
VAARVGWNIVTVHVRGEHPAYRLDQLEHDERYARAEEYTEVCYALWNSIGPSAIRADRAAGVFADPAKVRRVTHSGRYFRTDTIGLTLPSPQHRRVLFLAGSSGRGREFALRHAEVIFSIQPHAAGIRRFMQQLRDAARAQGRASPVRVTFGVQPILGGTEEEARRHQRARRAHPDRGRKAARRMPGSFSAAVQAGAAEPNRRNALTLFRPTHRGARDNPIPTSISHAGGRG